MEIALTRERKNATDKYRNIERQTRISELIDDFNNCPYDLTFQLLFHLLLGLLFSLFFFFLFFVSVFFNLPLSSIYQKSNTKSAKLLRSTQA